MSIHTPANAYRRKDMKWADSAHGPLRIIQHPGGGRGGSPQEWDDFVAESVTSKREYETERFSE
jgi:hypothetical protein